MRWEERRLLRRFGADYQAYLADVPRWVSATPAAEEPEAAVFGAILHRSPAKGA